MNKATVKYRSFLCDEYSIPWNYLDDGNHRSFPRSSGFVPFSTLRQQADFCYIIHLQRLIMQRLLFLCILISNCGGFSPARNLDTLLLISSQFLAVPRPCPLTCFHYGSI
ncbi:MAG: hypothetical protein FIB08_03890 [Candidatus Methanoperedens sp.]|nr:hypothetical protein [Candidatus Methanoperedens sp.]